MFNFDWSGWTKDTKPRDIERPFHRIGSPSYDENATQASGRGFDCGCRDPDRDYDPQTLEIVTSIIFGVIPGVNLLTIPMMALIRHTREQLLRTMPAWVPVWREGTPRESWATLPEQEKEVEGVLWRSFQTWTDVPVFQWHRWYDWNFHLVPARGFKYMRGLGNAPIGSGTTQRRPVGHSETMECEWDCGSISAPRPTLDDPGAMFQDGTDWVWPMTSQYIWIAGRWIYDCGHAERGLMRTELHPCKAIASSRWEAVKFAEHQHHVPAIQFMFFACRNGGYKDFPTLNDRDYEFIVDLPDPPRETMEFRVGHTPDFPMNTLVIRPRLLKKIDYSHFTNSFGTKAAAGAADPEVEFVPPAPGQLPKQVRVKIPLTKLGTHIDSYGVVLSLGWHDPQREQLDRVKRVVVKFLRIERIQTHEDDKAEWQLKYGVNGRWRATYKGELLPETETIALSQDITLHLAEDQFIYVSCHGMEEETVGNVMRESTSGRTLKDPDGQAYSWEGDIDQRDQVHAQGVAEAMLRKMAKTFNDQNEPLGIIDPGHTTHDTTDTPNPIQLRRLMELIEPGRTLNCKLSARLTFEDEHSAELFYNAFEKDYILHYTLEYHNQSVS